MNIVEARALQAAMDSFVRRLDDQHRFTASDIRAALGFVGDRLSEESFHAVPAGGE